MPAAYLDHAASTPMLAEAITAMMPFLDGCFANPTGSHSAAREARRAVDEARDELAACFGLDGRSVIWTGSGTEADNLALFGVHARLGGAIVTTAVEHHAVADPAERLGARVVGVDRHGAVDLDALADALDPTVRVVSVMAVNNETGTINPIRDAVALVRRLAPDAVVHCDAIQALSWIDVRPFGALCDAISISAHKFGGPKGVGALLVRPGLALSPMILGGGQEQERRSGTHNVAGIVAAARAATLTTERREGTVAQIAALRDRFVDTLTAELDGVTETVPRTAKVSGNAHVCIDGIESEAALFLLDRAGVQASAGSSCASGAVSVSPVLAAMGVTPQRARGALRFTLGATTTDSDIDLALEALVPIVRRLRARCGG